MCKSSPTVSPSSSKSLANSFVKDCTKGHLFLNYVTDYMSQGFSSFSVNHHLNIITQYNGAHDMSIITRDLDAIVILGVQYSRRRAQGQAFGRNQDYSIRHGKQGI
jgi:hypothetical protein